MDTKRKKMMLGISTIVVLATSYFAVEAMANRGDGALGTVYVISQDLYYDTFVTAQSLPPVGPFQLLYPDGSTMYGPGDPGYVGGRWWVDANGNGEMDAGDRYFLCPLLGPGREEP